MAESNVFDLNSSRERQASTISGYAMLLILLLSIVVQVWGIAGLANESGELMHIVAVVVAPFVLIFVACGF